MYKAAILSSSRVSLSSSSSNNPKGNTHRITTTLDEGTKNKYNLGHAIFHSGCQSVLTGAEFFIVSNLDSTHVFCSQNRSGVIACAPLRTGSYGRYFLKDSCSRKQGMKGEGGGATVVDALINHFRFLLSFYHIIFFLIETGACSRKK